MIGILAGHADDLEEELAFLLVHHDHFADVPDAAGDGFFDLAGNRVDQIEVVVSGALGRPEDFAGGGQAVDEEFLRVVDEGLAGVLEDRAHRSRVAADADDAHHLVAALVVDEGELRRISRPRGIGNLPGIFEQGSGPRRFPGGFRHRTNAASAAGWGRRVWRIRWFSASAGAGPAARTGRCGSCGG